MATAREHDRARDLDDESAYGGNRRDQARARSAESEARITPFLTSSNGAFLRSPVGGVEGVGEMRAAGMDWLALNVGDGHSWDSWRTVVERARAAKIEVLPWRRCYTLDECRDLLELAEHVSFRAILNVENEFETTVDPGKLETLIETFPTLDEVGISTVGWVYNDPAFEALAKRPVLLQIFATDLKRSPDELPTLIPECVAHARRKGFVHVGVTLQTYAPAEPSWYGFYEGVRSYYTGDDIGYGNWSEWAPA